VCGAGGRKAGLKNVRVEGDRGEKKTD